ncbi:MAG: MFS transporter [Nitrososphaerota archaeon]
MSNKFKLNERQRKFVPIVSLGAFFEGFDFMIISIILPYITRDYSITDETAAFVIASVTVGTILAFFFVRMADKVGRRPIFIYSVIIYSALSCATAVAPDIIIFTIFQFIARIFLVTCWAVGYIIMSEEFESEQRGRAIALFQSLAAVGAIFPSVLLPIVAITPLHWRGLYLVGGIPLFIMPFVAKRVFETQRFLEIKKGKTVESAPSLFEVFKKEYRGTLIVTMSIWYFVYLCYIGAMYFFAQRVVRELGWTETMLGVTTSIAFSVGLLGYAIIGKLLDTLGRKKASYIAFTGGAVFTIATFQATEFYIVALLVVITVLFLGTFTVVAGTITNELFPTEIRGTAMAWGNNIVGRLGQVSAPLLVGLLLTPLGGIGNAVSLLALGPMIASVIIALFVPETLKK